jgi:hypothetical protein
VIAGTVFQPSGLSLRGAEITVTPRPEPDSPPVKLKTQTTTSDERGEFAVRVPSGSMRYTVRVEAKGFQPDEKEVQVEWDQRVDVFFRLRAADNESGAKP